MAVADEALVTIAHLPRLRAVLDIVPVNVSLLVENQLWVIDLLRKYQLIELPIVEPPNSKVLLRQTDSLCLGYVLFLLAFKQVHARKVLLDLVQRSLHSLLDHEPDGLRVQHWGVGDKTGEVRLRINDSRDSKHVHDIAFQFFVMHQPIVSQMHAHDLRMPTDRPADLQHLLLGQQHAR